MSERRLLLAPVIAALLLGGEAIAWAQSDAGGATPGGSRELTASQAVAAALRTSPALRSATLRAESARQAVLGEEGRYPFVFFADGGYTRSASPRLGANDKVTTSPSHSIELGTGVRRTFATGTSAEVRVSGDRTWPENGGGDDVLVAGDTTAGGGGRTSYGAKTRATLSQPLIRGAGTDIGEADLRDAVLGREQAQYAERKAKSGLVRDVLVAYWELWYARRATEIERAALTLAERDKRDAETKVQSGALAPSGVLTFSTQVASASESVVSAETQEQERGIELERLIGQSSGNGPPLRAAATEPPNLEVPARGSLEAALGKSSVELAELEAQVRRARARAPIAGDAYLPRLDAEAYVETAGVSDNFPHALGRMATFGAVTVHAGLAFELPLDNARKNSERARALLDVSTAENDLQTAKDKVRADAASLVANGAAAKRRVALADQTEAIAKQSYEAERARFDAGAGLAISVQQAEEEWHRAQLRAVRARVDQAQNVIAITHLAGTLLTGDNVGR